VPGVQSKDRVIEAQSYKSDSGRWRPQALVSIHEGGSLRTHLVPAPLERVFHTEADADAHAVEMAKRWIDDTGPLERNLR
jgi:hypothetical protein